MKKVKEGRIKSCTYSDDKKVELSYVKKEKRIC